MILWPFDPKTTGLPTVHKPTGAYIMWAVHHGPMSTSWVPHSVGRTSFPSG
jgi:hypothetical protein